MTTTRARSLQLPITLAYGRGAYSVEITFGSARASAHLLLDSGSSTLVVRPQAYDPSRDAHLTATAIAQQVNYGKGAWAGPVLQSSAAFGHGEHARAVTAAHFSLVQSDAQDFRDADGILGLAYTGLNTGHDATALLAAKGVAPAVTWPWPFGTEDPAAVASFRTELLAQPRVPLTPLFTELESEGVVADVFALKIGRSLVHVLDDAATTAHLAADPLNAGVLVLGGGVEHESLYHGPFAELRVLHDLYYNVNLIAVQVGSRPPIAVPPIAAQYQSGYASNAIVDTGSTFLVLEQSVYDAVIADFGAIDARLPPLIAKFQQAFETEHGLPNASVDARHWPEIHLHLEAPDGGTTRLAIEPGAYWQHNAMHAGQAFFLLLRQLPHWPNQSILGLPVMANRFCIFDRRQGEGVIRMARARDA